MYLTFEEYTQFGGNLDETTFNNFEFKARSTIDWFTFNRLQKELEYPEAVKRCMYELIRLAEIQEQAGAVSAAAAGDTVKAGIASHSNDGVSVSYNVLSAQAALENSQKQIHETIQQYLQGVKDSLGHKLLYRGVYPDE